MNRLFGLLAALGLSVGAATCLAQDKPNILIIRDLQGIPAQPERYVRSGHESQRHDQLTVHEPVIMQFVFAGRTCNLTSSPTDMQK